MSPDKFPLWAKMVHGINRELNQFKLKKKTITKLKLKAEEAK